MNLQFDQPKINDRYQIAGMLGSGRWGRVYCARDQRTGRTVAIKLFSEDALSVAQQEFHLLAGLDHPGIVKVYDHGLDAAGRPFLVMEYLEGAADIVRSCRDRPLPQKLNSLKLMLQALAYLHSENILHRDLKPANVLLAGNRVKLLDFGLAQLFTDPHPKLQGTPAYLAPELLRGKPPSQASDIYACGIIAYECLSGNHPFNTATVNTLLLDLLYNQLQVDSLPIAQPMKDFLQSLTSDDPQQRPSAAGAVHTLANIQLPGADNDE